VRDGLACGRPYSMSLLDLVRGSGRSWCGRPLAGAASWHGREQRSGPVRLTAPGAQVGIRPLRIQASPSPDASGNHPPHIAHQPADGQHESFVADEAGLRLELAETSALNLREGDRGVALGRGVGGYGVATGLAWTYHRHGDLGRSSKP
jgi:hypothetical protein